MEDKEVIILLKSEVKSLATYLVDEDYRNALSDSKRETGWTAFATDFKIHWIKMRSKRHLFFYLASESARKFKVKQFHLDQRFKHYMQIIKAMDEEYILAQELHPEEFTGAEAFSLFGHKVDAGFAYDEFGRDITYDSDQSVIIAPESS